MRLLLIGRPGSGKGTQAQAIADHFGIVHISSGDLLRRHVADDTQLGRTIAATLAGCDADLARDLREEGAALRVVRALLALDRRPFGVSGHRGRV